MTAPRLCPSSSDVLLLEIPANICSASTRLASLTYSSCCQATAHTPCKHTHIEYKSNIQSSRLCPDCKVLKLASCCITVLLFESSNGLLPCIQTDCGVMSSLLPASVIAAVECQESFGPEGSDDQLARSTLVLC